MSFTRETIKIDSATSGWQLELWQCTPKEFKRPGPVVVFAHGLAGLKAHSLSGFAERFAEIGVATILFDYRHWGGSDGTPRNLLIPSKQHEDYRTVIAWVRSRPDVFDAHKICVMGSSFSGGSAIVVAAGDPDLAGAISQCPHVDSVVSALALPYSHTLKMTAAGLYDYARQALGLEPLYMPAYGPENGWAFLNQHDALPGFQLVSGAPPTPQGNRVQASLALTIAAYRPTTYASSVKIPVLACIAEKDSMCPVDAAHAMIDKVAKGEKMTYPGGHFDPYPGGKGHEEAVAAQLAFLKRIM